MSSWQVQCITHFLKLPIEDDFLDQLEEPERVNVPPNLNNQEKSDLGPNRQITSQIPFMDQGNPVMAQVRPSPELLWGTPCSVPIRSLSATAHSSSVKNWSLPGSLFQVLASMMQDSSLPICLLHFCMAL